MQQRSPEWFAERAKRLTGSDWAAALGLNPYCSRQKLWRLKTGLEQVTFNHHMERGVEYEADLVFEYEVATGHVVDEVGLVVHPAHDWLAASPDGLVGDRGLLEGKCPAVLKDELSAAHFVQCQAQLECADRDWCDYVQWVDGEIVTMRVARSTEFFAIALPLLREFWAYVTDLQQPPRAKANAELVALVDELRQRVTLRLSRAATVIRKVPRLPASA